MDWVAGKNGQTIKNKKYKVFLLRKVNKAAQIYDLKLTRINFITLCLLLSYYIMQGECGILEMNIG